MTVCTLRTLGAIGLEVAPLTDVAITSVRVMCPPFESIPPGHKTKVQ